MQGAASLVYLSSSDMYKLINYSSFVNWLAVGLSVVALLYFRWKRPNAPRPIKVLHLIAVQQLVCLVMVIVVAAVATMAVELCGTDR